MIILRVILEFGILILIKVVDWVSVRPRNQMDFLWRLKCSFRSVLKFTTANAINLSAVGLMSSERPGAISEKFF